MNEFYFLLVEKFYSGGKLQMESSIQCSEVSIEKIFDDVKSKVPHLLLHLASGSIVDSRGPMTSDMDIIVIIPNYTDVDFTPLKIVSIDVMKERKKAIYHVGGYLRPVEITVSSEWEKLRSVLHRQVQLSLMQFSNVVAEVTTLKKRGTKTGPAWAQVLGLDEKNPYTEMLRGDLISIASRLNKRI